MKRRIAFIAGLSAVGLMCVAWLHQRGHGGSTRPPIKVGVLHSLTGTMAISEKSVVDATLMAIEEINLRGGVLGRRVEPVVIDGCSDLPAFARGAEQLIVSEKVATVFGCWTSASRKTVKPIFERHNHLLIYPVQYEGLEQSPNIVYTGAAPNQQIIPAVNWSLQNLGPRLFLVGSDYVFPRTANAIIKAQVTALRGTIVGEEYIPLGSSDAAEVVRRVAAARPDAILNTINGDSNRAFFRELRAAGIRPGEIPTVSFSIAEEELRVLDAVQMAGDYAAWNYFQSHDSEANQEFVRNFKNRYGPERVTDDPIEAGYFGVYLWAQAVERAGSNDVQAIRRSIKGQTFAAPGGIVHVDAQTQHTWKTVKIGRIRPDGQFEVVWSSEKPIRPNPYPGYCSRAEWEALLDELYRGWGGRWARPAETTLEPLTSG